MGKLTHVDCGKIYTELLRLDSEYLRGQRPESLLYEVRISVKRLRRLLPEDLDLADGCSLVALGSLSDFVRHLAALYHTDNPTGFPEGIEDLFFEHMAEELHCLIPKFRQEKIWQEREERNLTNLDQEDGKYPWGDDDPEAPFSAAKIADRLGIPPKDRKQRDTLSKRLETWRRENPKGGWIEDEQGGGRKAKYSYPIGKVWPIVEDMKISS